MQQDSEQYLAKKRFFDRVLTIYGRKPVLEALQQPEVQVHKLHLASSNQKSSLIDDIVQLASDKGAAIAYHDKRALSRISKNAKQDQGVAADLLCPGFLTLEESVSEQAKAPRRLLALDGITNPQNLGMIIRSACAGNIQGIIIPEKGCAQIDPLVIKASVGTVFRAPIIRTQLPLAKALAVLKENAFSVIGLSSHATNELGNHTQVSHHTNEVYVLGNETSGVSEAVQKTCTDWVKISMNNGVESLNVAVTAALIAFQPL